MRIGYIKNFRRGFATNSSSTHSVIYRNEGEMLNDMNGLDCDYYDRYTNYIIATKEAKIKYILAAIMYNDTLVEIMSSIYPQMKEYFPLIKESEEEDEWGDSFGMYTRESLMFEGDEGANVLYLKRIIEDDNIVIVGGSDETDFVDNIEKDHVHLPIPADVKYYSCGKNKKGVVKNGNYYVGYGRSCNEYVRNYNDIIKNSSFGRLRFVMDKDDDPIPSYPELIDLKITDACDFGCPFCYVSSEKDGRHADIKEIRKIFYGVPDEGRIEFAIGGGDVLLHPQLEEILKLINRKGHIANITINAKSCRGLIEDEGKMKMLKEYVCGIGISVVSASQLDDVDDFSKAFTDEYEYGNEEPVIHLIPEMLGVEKTSEILKKMRDMQMYSKVLFLGYKNMGRGVNVKHDELSGSDLREIFGFSTLISIDTVFANRYKDYLQRNYSVMKTVTYNEGEYSMYIDAVKGYAYKSSYNLEKPYKLMIGGDRDWSDSYSITDAFRAIRKDGGFKTIGQDDLSYLKGVEAPK